MTTDAILSALLGGLVGALIGAGTSVGALIVSFRHQAHENHNDRLRAAYDDLQSAARNLDSLALRVLMPEFRGQPAGSVLMGRLYDQMDDFRRTFYRSLLVMKAEDAPEAVIAGADAMMEAWQVGDDALDAESLQASKAATGKALEHLKDLLEAELRRMREPWYRRRRKATVTRSDSHRGQGAR